MTEAQRVGARPEVEGAAVEDAVDGTGDRAAACGDRREHEQADPGQPTDDLLGRRPALGRVDAEQVRSCLLVAAIEQTLERGDLGGRLVHAGERSTSGARAPSSYRSTYSSSRSRNPARRWAATATAARS